MSKVNKYRLRRIAYESCAVSIRQHLRTRKSRNDYLECVLKHEEQKLLRVGNELLQSAHIVDDPHLITRGISRMYTQLKLKPKAESFEANFSMDIYIKSFRKMTTLIRNLLDNGQPIRL